MTTPAATDTVTFRVGTHPGERFAPDDLADLPGSEAALRSELSGLGWSVEAPTQWVRVIAAVVDPDGEGATITVARTDG